MADARETRDLPVVLTKKELRIRGHQLALAVERVKQLKLEKKVAAASFKEKIETAEAELNDLYVKVKERKELRPVDVVWEANYERSTMELVRLDTHEAIQVRAMTDRERQRQLFPVEAPTSDEKPVTEERAADDAGDNEASASEPESAPDEDEDEEVGEDEAAEAMAAAERELEGEVDGDPEEDLDDEDEEPAAKAE